MKFQNIIGNGVERIGIKDIARTVALQEFVFLKDAVQVLTAFFDCVVEGLERGDRVNIRGFGTFVVRKHGRRRRWDVEEQKMVESKEQTRILFREQKNR